MAASIICDKCGKTSVKTSEFMHIRTHVLISSTEFKTYPMEYFDVCKNCYDEIFKFKEDL